MLLLAALLTTFPPLPMTGAEVPELESFDREIQAFMQENDIAGASVAVSRHGKVIYARGFGLASRETKDVVQPTSLFRIASISKPITGAAIGVLVKQGKVKLDEPVYPALGYTSKDVTDPRILTVTVRQALQHTGGWDRGQSGDPMFMHPQIAEALYISAPVGTNDVIRYMATQPLDFAPGTREAYSNFGYCLLGRLIEKRTGETYEAFVKREVLKPAGVTDMKIGHTLPQKRDPKEVFYYSREPERPSITDPSRKVQGPDGQFWLETMDAHGGWIANASDLVRFSDRLFGANGMPLVGQDWVTETVRRQSFRSPQEQVWYGLGWQVREVGNGGYNLWHTGALSGTSSILVRLSNGNTWAAILNGRTNANLDGALHRAANQVTKWPE